MIRRAIATARKVATPVLSNGNRRWGNNLRNGVLGVGGCLTLLGLSQTITAEDEEKKSSPIKHDPYCPCDNPEKHPCTNKKAFVPGCHELKVFSGNANPALANSVCKELGTGVGAAQIKQFNDGEVSIQISESVRGKDVYIVQPTAPPVNESVMELILMISTLRRASAKRVTAVIPYYGYRRNNQSAANTQLSQFLFSSASDIGKMLQVAGVERVIVVGLMDANKQFLGWVDGHFFDGQVPVEVLDVSTIACDYFIEKKDMTRPIVIVTPRPKCLGAANRFREQLSKARPDLKEVRVGAVLFGNRDGKMEDKPNGWTGAAENAKYEGHTGVVTELIGDVDGCDVIVLDEAISSANTMVAISKNLKSRGAHKIYGVVTHSLLTKEAWHSVQGSPIDQLIVTDTVPLPKEQQEPGSKLVQISIAPVIAKIIRNDHYGNGEMDL